MNKLLQRYRRLSVQAKSSLWYTVTQVFQKGIGFIIVPLYTRILSAGDYGRYTIFSSWYEVMLVFGTLKIYGNSFNVGITKFETDRNRYTSSMVGFGAVCTLSFFFVVCIFPIQFEMWLEMSFSFIMLLFLEVFWNPSLSLWSQRQRYEYKYKALNALTITSIASTPVIGILLIYLLPDKALGAILGKSLPQILTGMICAYLILRKSKTLCNKEYWCYIFKFNVPLIIYFLSRVLLNQIDRLMIQKMGTVSQVGIYSVANSASYGLGIVSSAINVSFIPYMFQQMKAHKESKIKEMANVLITFVALCNIYLIALAPEAMKIMSSMEYQEGVWLIPPLVCSTFISFVYQMYINVEFYYEKKFTLMCASIGICLCNFILNYAFIKIFGYIAAGYTTLASSIFCLAVHYICVRRILRTEKIQAVFQNRYIARICLCFIGFSAIMLMLYDYMIIRYAVIFLISIGCYSKCEDLVGRLKELKR